MGFFARLRSGGYAVAVLAAAVLTANGAQAGFEIAARAAFRGR